MSTAAEKRRAAEQEPASSEEQRAALDEALAPVEGSQALVKPESGMERYTQDPVITRINPKQFALIKRTIGVNASDDEVAWFLELCAHYDLDWAAREAWLAKSESRNGREGKLLIMVGRDGLRKIAQRNGLDLRGDVLHEKDGFEVEHRPDRTCVVTHRYGHPKDRGEITGAWCEAWDRRTGRQVGFFYAALGEYKPKDVSSYSPWSKQVSVMILAAAERQAARQGTPLGGLLVEGEDEVINATAVEVGGAEALPEGLPPEVTAAVERARRLGHVGLSHEDTARMVLAGQPPEAVEAWVARATAELDEFEAAQEVTVEVFCGAADPVREGVHCERPEGHEPPHLGNGMTWDAYREADPVVEDELGPATAEQLDAEIAEAEALVAAAQTESEYVEGMAKLTGLRELRAGAEPGQEQLL